MISRRINRLIVHFPACVFLIAGVIVTVEAAGDQPQLKLVSAVFRHGDRAPDPVELFPNDPYFNEDFFPMGLGGLTNQGKVREYELGKLLRRLYKNFLGDLYLPDSVLARSTDYKRTKMCLQLVLSALYPPSGAQIWNNELMWQPIPTTYVPPEKDWLMIPEECPEYLRERRKAEIMPEVRSKIASFQSFTQNLTELTGKHISSPNDMYNLYHILVAESHMNLQLPEWTAGIFPDGKLLDGINLEYEIFSYTTNMRRLNGGKLLHKILSEMQALMTGSIGKNRRINLFSGHETNIAALLQTLGLYKPHVPAYSSAVIMELHELNSEYYVKILYYKGVPAVLEAQKILGCEIFCPFNKFVEILSEVIPENHELVCDKTKTINEIELIDNTIKE